MKTTLCIDRLKISTRIGCVTWEQEAPRYLYISLRLMGDFSAAILSDKLEDAVDYVRVSEDVLAYADGAKNELLESLLRDIVGICLEYDQVDHVRAKVEKEYLPFDFRAVGVEIEATR